MPPRRRESAKRAADAPLDSRRPGDLESGAPAPPDSESPKPGSRGGARAVGALVFAAYLAIAFGVRNLYPFSVFDMYATKPSPRAARIGARDASGALLEPARFSAFSCEAPVADAVRRCNTAHGISPIEYVLEEQLQAIGPKRELGEGAEPVTLVVKMWGLDASGIAEEAECEVSRCSATRVR